MKKWRTAISAHSEGELYIRGRKLTKLIEENNFSQSVFLLLKGVEPKPNEEKMLDTILVAMIEHGVEVPSAFVGRVVASTGNQMNAALAGSVLAVGDHHGGAIEECARLLQSGESAQKIVGDLIAQGKRMPGYGHKIYKDKDPRTEVIFKKAKTLKLSNKYIGLAQEIAKELEKKSNKKLPINIDGAVAAILSELGLDWRLGKALFVLGRMPGMIAHIHEEIIREKPYRRLDEGDVEYDGPTLQT